MTIKNFYLEGQDKDAFKHEIHIEQYHDFEALQLAVAGSYNIIDPNGIGFQDPKGSALQDLDEVLDCD